MSLWGYKPKTKPALWKQLPSAGKTLCEVFAKEERDREKAAKKLAARMAKSGRRRIALKRNRIAPASNRRAVELRTYKARSRAWLKENPVCQACPRMAGKTTAANAQPHPAQAVHHKHGRSGPLLLDERYWLAVCDKSHDWIHRNVSKARAAGLIAELGKWNRPD